MRYKTKTALCPLLTPALLLVVLAGTSHAQSVSLVKNINTVTNATLSDSSPASFAQVGVNTFFIAAGNNKGSELWITDGSPAGTRLVKDINPGSGNGAGGQLLVYNGGVLFQGTDANGSELWFSDGTEAGTVQIKDISIGTGSSSPNTFVDMGSYALFTANNGAVNGNELWRTDGTLAGTFMVKDIFPGASASSPNRTRRIGSTAYFSAQGSLESGGTNFELWKTDGTEAGTVLVKDIRLATSNLTGSSTPSGFTEYNGFVYFAASEGTTTGRRGIELWRTDGTELGTMIVADINPGTTNGMPNEPTFIPLNGKLYFFASAPATGFELYSYDDVNGVQLVADVNPGTLQSNPVNLTLLGSQLFFSTTFAGSGTNLVVSDGTAAGTSLIAAVAGGFENINAPLTVHQGKLYFAADDVVNGSSVSELWTSDGTLGGTQLVADLGPAGPSSSPQNIFSAGSQILFSATTPAFGRELWTSDGTTGGTVLFKDLNAGDFTGSGIASMAALNGKLIFSASDGIVGKELWTSDGTESGTVLVKDIGPGASGSDPADPGTTFPDGFFPFNGKLFFNALQQNLTGIELWSTDGTESGTSLLKDINTVDQTDFAPEPTGFTLLNGKLVFRARQPIAQGGLGSELWESDGTPEGTVLLADIRVGGTSEALASSTPQFLTFFDRPGTDPDWVVFSATGTTTQGNELWRSDGTAAGTVLIKDINTAANGNSNPSNITAIGDRLFFGAGLSTGGQELWVSDGTNAGTVQIADINTQFATASSNPGPFYEINGRVIFQAAAGNTTTNPAIPAVGGEIWSTNLTGGDFMLLKDIRTGTLGSNPTSFVKLGNFYYFTAEEGTTQPMATGRELWRTDGTPAGTVLFADINPGTGSSTPTSLTVIDGFLYFAAGDGTAQGGIEAYRTDGLTPPVRIADINPDGSSNPSLFTKVGDSIYFTASDGANGAELWVLTTQARCGLSDIAGPGQSIGSDNALTADDIIVFLNWFFAGNANADIAGPGQSTTPDSQFTADDIIVFLNRFFAGC